MPLAARIDVGRFCKPSVGPDGLQNRPTKLTACSLLIFRHDLLPASLVREQQLDQLADSAASARRLRDQVRRGPRFGTRVGNGHRQAARRSTGTSGKSSPM